METASHASVVYDEDGWMGSMCSTAEPPWVALVYFFFEKDRIGTKKGKRQVVQRATRTKASVWKPDLSKYTEGDKSDLEEGGRVFKTTVSLTHSFV